jgi:hypothetical protein
MIEMPRRSITRFFIPLIDVLTVMFSVFLLMPLVGGADESPESDRPAVGLGRVPSDPRQLARDYDELRRLREEHRSRRDVEDLEKKKKALGEQVQALRERKIDDLQKQLSVRVLEIGEEGNLHYYDPKRDKDRRIRITAENVADFIATQQRQAGGKDVFFLLMYPRPERGDPAYPLVRQREEFDRWFKGVAHGYDVR